MNSCYTYKNQLESCEECFHDNENLLAAGSDYCNIFETRIDWQATHTFSNRAISALDPHALVDGFAFDLLT